MKNSVVFLFFVLLSIFFFLFPEVDLWFSGLFYSPDSGFTYRNNMWIQSLYHILGNVHFVLLAIILAGFLLAIKYKWFEKRRRLMVFALVVLIVGPGLIVNAALKNHWDRARPRDIVEFGGHKQFSPAWVISDQCETNCSFVSGHATMAFCAMILGWLLGRRQWLWAGVFFGLLIGLVRILQGGHFVSDVLLAGFISYFVIVFFARCFDVPEPK
jgi:lipid A 4'-phosphatase